MGQTKKFTVFAYGNYNKVLTEWESDSVLGRTRHGVGLDVADRL